MVTGDNGQCGDNQNGGQTRDSATSGYSGLLCRTSRLGVSCVPTKRCYYVGFRMDLMSSDVLFICVCLLSELSGWGIGLPFQSVLPIPLVSNLLLDGSIWSFGHQGFLVHLGASHSIQVVLHASGSCVQRVV